MAGGTSCAEAVNGAVEAMRVVPQEETVENSHLEVT